MVMLTSNNVINIRCLMTVYPFNISNNFIELRDTFYSALTNSSRFNEKIFKTFSEAYSVYLKITLEEFSKDLPELEKHVRSKISDIFNLRFREEDFVSTLSDTLASYSALAKSTGFGRAYRNFLFGGQTGIIIS